MCTCTSGITSWCLDLHRSNQTRQYTHSHPPSFTNTMSFDFKVRKCRLLVLHRKWRPELQNLPTHSPGLSGPGCLKKLPEGTTRSVTEGTPPTSLHPPSPPHKIIHYIMPLPPLFAVCTIAHVASCIVPAVSSSHPIPCQASLLPPRHASGACKSHTNNLLHCTPSAEDRSCEERDSCPPVQMSQSRCMAPNTHLRART